MGPPVWQLDHSKHDRQNSSSFFSQIDPAMGRGYSVAPLGSSVRIRMVLAGLSDFRSVPCNHSRSSRRLSACCVLLPYAKEVFTS